MLFFFRVSDFPPQRICLRYDVLRIWLRLRRAMAAGALFYALPLALMFLLALTPGINFTEDLGRHLLLGKIIVTTGQLPDTNFLTYTCPDFPFINHHWLSEVVFYFAHRAVGLNGLIALKALLMCATLALAMRSVPLHRASPLVAFAATLAAIALGYRAHIRPELFTYLGVALYGWLIARSEQSPAQPGSAEALPASPERYAVASRPGEKLSGRSWAVLIAYGWFWANAHIYFIFGIGMIGAYWLACWWRNWPGSADPAPPERYAEARALRPGERGGAEARALHSGERACYSAKWRSLFATKHEWPRSETIGLLALIGVSLLNPNSWRGLLYPLGIFGNYGLAITENASPLSYWETVLNPMLIALPFLTGCALWVFWRAGRCHNKLGGRAEICSARQNYAQLELGATSGLQVSSIKLSAGRLAECIILFAALLAAWRMARNAPLLALTLLPPLFFCARVGMSKLEVGRTLRVSRSSSDGSAGTPRPTLLKFLCLKSACLRGIALALVIALNLWLAFAIVGGSYNRIFPSPIGPTPFGFDDESRYLALRRLRADGLPLPLFSDYNYGSLVEYNIYPEPGYVDNRPEAFPAAFWQQEYEPALALGAVWEDMIARRGIQTVAVSIAGVKEGFIRTLLADPRWQLVHLDFFCAIFARNTPENQDFLRRHAFGQERARLFAHQTAQRIRALSSQSLWRRQVLADQIIYEIYGLICLGACDLAWPLVWDMHLRYPDYQLIHELMRVSAPPRAGPAVRDVMARRARWPLAAKQALDWGAALEAQGRTDEARAVYRRGQRFFPLSPNWPPPAPAHSSHHPAPSVHKTIFEQSP